MATGTVLGMRKAVFFLILAALVIRLSAVPLVHRSGYTSDEREYVTIAQRMISGEGFLDSNGFRSVRAPLYPALLALLLIVSGLPAAHILGCALGSIAVYQTYRLALLVWGDEKAALAAATAMCVHPGLVIYSTLLQTEILYICFLLSALTAGYGLVNGEGGARAVVLGAASGLAALTRAVYLVFFPFLLAGFWWIKKDRSPAGIKYLSVAVVVCVVILAPWAFRNLQIHGSWIPVSSGGGGSLLTGNNPYATGTWRNEDGFEQWFSESVQKKGIADPNSLGEVERNNLSGVIAREYMRDHPGRTLGLALKKSHIFWIYPITHTDSYLPVQAIAVGFDALLLLGAALGAVAGWKYRRQLFPLFLSMVFFWLVQAVLHAEARFRLPLVPILSVLFGYGAATLASRNRASGAFALPGPRIAFSLCAAGIIAVYGFTGWMFLQGVIH